MWEFNQFQHRSDSYRHDSPKKAVLEGMENRVFYHQMKKKYCSMHIIFLSLSLNLSKSLNLPLPKQRQSVLCVFLFPPFLQQETRKSTIRRWWESLLHNYFLSSNKHTDQLCKKKKRNKNHNLKKYHLDRVIYHILMSAAILQSVSWDMFGFVFTQRK